MKNKTWDYKKTICFKDVTVYGTCYFSRYFEWMGEAREIYYTNVREFRSLGEKGIALVTKSAWVDYINPIYAFDEIEISIYNSSFKTLSFQMNFDIFNLTTNKLAAQGGNVLIFIDSNRKIIKVPENIIEWVTQHR
jgi:YbgC/YbaW family acyl-CoA thioester hydrolase